MFIKLLLVLPVGVVLAVSRAVAAGPPDAADLARGKAMALQICATLQVRAEQMEQEGRPSGLLRRAFAIKAGLNDAETEVLLGVASRMRARIAPLDNRAQAIIRSFRRQHAGGRLQPGVLPPPPPPELTALQRQRDVIVEEAVRELDSQLGPAGLEKLHRQVSRARTSTTGQNAQNAAVRTPAEIRPLASRMALDSRRQEVAR